MKLNEAETLYMFGLVRSDLDDLRRRENHLRRLLDAASDRQKNRHVRAKARACRCSYWDCQRSS